MAAEKQDLLTLGKRIRHYRQSRELTLDDLSTRVDAAASHLSLIENGRREPRLSLLQDIATALDIELQDLLSTAPPDKRAALEIELEQAQTATLYKSLGLPEVRPSKRLPTAALEALVGMHRELQRKASEASATPEEARRANTQLRLWMRERNNYLPDIEELGEDMMRSIGYERGALTHRAVARLAERLGFEIIHVTDLPHSTRTVTDLRNGRIYLPPTSIPGGHGLRSMALQAIAHRLLEHGRPSSYAEFLRQRVEINYFAATCLMPRFAAVEFLQNAKANRDLAVEDLRDAFGVTHETAAMRITNLGTSYLDIPVHYLRVGHDGALYKGYENDGLGFATDVTGAIEGQLVCRKWGARRVFERGDRTSEYHQYTMTPNGNYWSATQTGTTAAGEEFSISFGVPYQHAKWFRGRDTKHRYESTCPEESCCRTPNEQLRRDWAEHAWPSATMHAQILAPLPSGTFPGVDDREVYEFLEKHAPQ